MAPVRSNTTIGCRVIGEQGEKTRIMWSREGERFRDGSYSMEGDTITLDMVGVQDAGYYYCSATQKQGETKTASIQVQVSRTIRIRYL